MAAFVPPSLAWIIQHIYKYTAQYMSHNSPSGTRPLLGSSLCFTKAVYRPCGTGGSHVPAIKPRCRDTNSFQYSRISGLALVSSFKWVWNTCRTLSNACILALGSGLCLSGLGTPWGTWPVFPKEYRPSWLDRQWHQMWYTIRNVSCKIIFMGSQQAYTTRHVSHIIKFKNRICIRMVDGTFTQLLGHVLLKQLVPVYKYLIMIQTWKTQLHISNHVGSYLQQQSASVYGFTLSVGLGWSKGFPSPRGICELLAHYYGMAGLVLLDPELMI